MCGLVLAEFLEGVAYPGFSYDVSGQAGVWFYLLAQMRDVDAYIVQVISIFPAPHLFQELLVGKNTAGILYQEGKQAELSRGELNPLAIGYNLPLSDINGKEAIAIDNSLPYILRGGQLGAA